MSCETGLEREPAPQGREMTDERGEELGGQHRVSARRWKHRGTERWISSVSVEAADTVTAQSQALGVTFGLWGRGLLSRPIPILSPPSHF